MFNRKLKTDSFTDIISENTIVNGPITFSGVLKIQGNVDGPIVSGLESTIIVDDTGKVIGDIRTTNIVISGYVKGDIIWAEDTLRIMASATIESGATIYYRRLEVEPGAVLHDCQLKHLDRSSEGETT
jgi:cytoskeletal protein CcmA (bactofilin family)